MAGANQQSAGHLMPLPLFHATCIFLSLGLIAGWRVICRRDDPEGMGTEIIDRLATMEVASVLQTDSKVPNPVAIFCGQKEREAWINYVTGIRSVGSLYWDNPSGIRAEAEFLATCDEEAAHRIACPRGINYVVVMPSGGDVIAYHYMWQGNKSAPRIRETLAYRLAAPNPAPPAWLQLLPGSTPAIHRGDLRVYRVLYRFPALFLDAGPEGLDRVDRYPHHPNERVEVDCSSTRRPKVQRLTSGLSGVQPPRQKRNPRVVPFQLRPPFADEALVAPFARRSAASFISRDSFSTR